MKSGKGQKVGRSPDELGYMESSRTGFKISGKWVGSDLL